MYILDTVFWKDESLCIGSGSELSNLPPTGPNNHSMIKIRALPLQFTRGLHDIQ